MKMNDYGGLIECGQIDDSIELYLFISHIFPIGFEDLKIVIKEHFARTKRIANTNRLPVITL